jgi:hypothetical protein
MATVTYQLDPRSNQPHLIHDPDSVGLPKALKASQLRAFKVTRDRRNGAVEIVSVTGNFEGI